MCGFCAFPTLQFYSKLRKAEKKMVIFSEGSVVLGWWDIVLLCSAVKTCGLHRRGNCTCGRHIVLVLDGRRRIIWRAMCLELLREEANCNRNSVGLMAESLASNSAVGLTNRLRAVCGFGQSWKSPLIWALWVFVITSGSSWSYLRQPQVPMHAVITSRLSESVWVFKSGLGKVWRRFLLVSVSSHRPEARDICVDVCWC